MTNTAEPVSVVMAGVGGTNSWAAHAVARMLNTTAPGSVLKLVDGDHFEPKNASRQNFTSMGYKSEVVGNEIAEFADQTFVSPIVAWIVDDESASEADDDVNKITAETLLEDGDYVFVTVDNYATRKLIFEAAQKLDNVTVINGGNEDNGFGSIYTYVRRNGVDITDYIGNHYKEFVDPPDRNPAEMSCAERAKLPSGTQIISTNMAVAAQMTLDFSKVAFADAVEEDDTLDDQYHFAGLVLANDKVFEMDYGQATANARCSEEVFKKMCDINPDVASVVHDVALDLTAEVVSVS